jgi:FkbM family methyltransferase
MWDIDLVKAKHGTFLVPKVDEFIGQSLKLNKEWEEKTLDICKQILKSDSIVVEVGSHIGSHTVPISRMCGRVFAFEMQRLIFQLLNANLMLNGRLNVHTHSNPVSNESSTIKLAEMNWGASEENKLNTGNGKFANLKHDKGYPTKIVTLDEELGHLKQISLLKLDAEGEEVNILKGSKEIIKKFKPHILTEFGERNVADLRELLKDEYELFDVSSKILFDVDNLMMYCKPRI